MQANPTQRLYGSRSSRSGLVILSVLAGYGSLTVLLVAPYGLVYPASIVCIWVFIIGFQISQRRGQTSTTVVSPLALAQLFFAFQLVVIPLSYMLAGAERATLPWLPSTTAINCCLLLQALAYLVFTWGSGCRRPPAGIPAAAGHGPTAQRQLGGRMTWALVVVFVLLGAAGFYFQFGSIESFISYLVSPATQIIEAKQMPTTLAAALATILRPFLSFGIVLVWCSWIERSRKARGLRHVSNGAVVGTAVTCLLLLVVNVSFNFNRAAMIVPVLAVVATYSLHVRPIQPRWLILLALVILLWGLLWGALRASSDLSATRLGPAELSQMLQNSRTVESLQVYGGGAQFLGFLLEETSWATNPYWGETLISSALFPMPAAGRLFRPTSGVVLYNMLIYNDPSIADQVIPFSGELFINFHILGLVVGYLLLGLVVAAANRKFLNTCSCFDAYCMFMVAYWFCFLMLGSIAAVSQVFIFLLWPIYAYAVVKQFFGTKAMATVSLS